MKPKPSEIAEWAVNEDSLEFPSQAKCIDLARAYLRLLEAAEALLDNLGTPGGVVNTAYLRKILEETDDNTR